MGKLNVPVVAKQWLEAHGFKVDSLSYEDDHFVGYVVSSSLEEVQETAVQNSWPLEYVGGVGSQKRYAYRVPYCGLLIVEVWPNYETIEVYLVEYGYVPIQDLTFAELCQLVDVNVPQKTLLRMALLQSLRTRGIYSHRRAA